MIVYNFDVFSYLDRRCENWCSYNMIATYNVLCTLVAAEIFDCYVVCTIGNGGSVQAGTGGTGKDSVASGHGNVMLTTEDGCQGNGSTVLTSKGLAGSIGYFTCSEMAA